jgi:uncharacterized protein YaaQ
MKTVNRLLTAVIQIQDLDKAVRALNKAGFIATQISSTGGFLGRRNVTLLIGLEAGQEESVVKSLSKSCRRRIEYIATPLEGVPFHMPLSTPVTVGGATVFTIDVERYEEF